MSQIPTGPAISSAVNANPVPQVAQDDPLPNRRLEFLWKVHSYTNEYIRFADPKAAIAIAISSGLLTALFAAKCHQILYPSNLSWADATLRGTFVGLMSGPAFVLLAFSILFCSWAVVPRLWQVFFHSTIDRVRHYFQTQTVIPQPGFIFWDDVLNHPDAAAFALAAGQLTQAQMTDAVARHVYVLAGIASRKFRWVTWGFRCGYAGVIFACLALLFA